MSRFWALVRSRLRGRADSEHAQVFVRIAITALFSAYLGWEVSGGGASEALVGTWLILIGELALSLGLIAAPVAFFLPHGYAFSFGDWNLVTEAPWLLPLFSVVGVVLLFATLHLARVVGLFHGWLAKHLLVRTPVV